MTDILDPEVTAPYRVLMDEAAIPAEDRPLLVAGMNQCLHMVPGYRPSDAMRSELRRYQELGAVAYRAEAEAAGVALREMGY